MSASPCASATGRVVFIGAGPGDPELLTVKAARLISQADLVLYAGSLVSPGVVALAGPQATVADSSGLTLGETHALLLDSVTGGGLAARVHTGDPSLYGAIAEQARLLTSAGVDYEIVPGVTTASAAAAAFRVSFTVPEATQTLILTRLAGRTPMPAGEDMADLARHGASMAIYLSAGDPEGVQAALTAGGYAGDTPVAVAHRLGWPGEQLFWTSLAELPERVRQAKADRQTIFLVLPGRHHAGTSKLYDATFAHGFRPAKEKSASGGQGGALPLPGPTPPGA